MADWLGGEPGLDCPSLLLSISGLILQEADWHQSTAGAPGYKGCSGLCLCPIGQSGSCGRGQRPGMEEQAPSGWEAAVTRPRGVHPGSRGGHETWREGWREDHSRRALGRKWGLLSPACTKPNQSRGQGRLRGGSGPQGGGPLSPSAHPPVLHPLSQRLWPGEPGGGHARPRPGSPALACPGGSASAQSCPSFPERAAWLPGVRLQGRSPRGRLRGARAAPSAAEGDSRASFAEKDAFELSRLWRWTGPAVQEASGEGLRT